MAISQTKIDKIKSEAPAEIEGLDKKIQDFNKQIEVLTAKRREAEAKRSDLKAKLSAIIELEK